MLESFYRENYHFVFGYLRSLCGDAALTEELTAQVFLKAIERADSYDPRYRPATWLCTIGRNLYIDHCRKNKPLPLDFEPEATVPSPELLLIQKEQAKAVLRVANDLPTQQRQVLFMRLEGMDFRAIGTALGKSENWARVTYYRARTKILTEMEESGWTAM